MGEITPQQTLVFERLKDTLTTAHEFNKQISERVAVTIGASTALVAAFASTTEITFDFSRLPVWMLIGTVVCSGIAFLIASFIWCPKAAGVPGAFEVDPLWQNYIAPKPDVAMSNVINDLVEAIKVELTVNKSHAFWFRWMLLFIWGEVAFVIVALFIT